MEKRTLFVLLWKSTYLEKHRFYTDQEESQNMQLEGKKDRQSLIIESHSAGTLHFSQDVIV